MNAATSLLRTVLILLCALAVPIGLAAQESANKPEHHHYKVVDVGTFGGPQTISTISTSPIGLASSQPSMGLPK
jgi:hypothetical protein